LLREEEPILLIQKDRSTIRRACGPESRAAVLSQPGYCVKRQNSPSLAAFNARAHEHELAFTLHTQVDSIKADQSASLSPLAVAFLVGYAVDIFFSFLEGSLQNLRSNSGQKKTPP